MELHAVDTALVVLQHGHRGPRGRSRDAESLRRLGDTVEVAHPHVVLLGRVVGQEQRRAGAGQPGPAVLALHPAADHTAELLSDELSAVADAEHGTPRS
jgi:hypothetical protein